MPPLYQNRQKDIKTNQYFQDKTKTNLTFNKYHNRNPT